MSRTIVLDTETTGIGPEKGHRIIEIGCVELVNRKLTGNHYHVYLNPQRKVDEGAFAVHGISDDFLADKPLFKQIVSDFIAFIKDSELVIHNAPFDVGFINHELGLLSKSPFGNVENYCQITDSLQLARKKHTGQKNSLDALCKRYAIDNSNRVLHGALLDAELLAEVYLGMTGGQTSLVLHNEEKINNNINNSSARSSDKKHNLRIIKANEQECLLHKNKLAEISKSSGQPSIWEQCQE